MNRVVGPDGGFRVDCGAGNVSQGPVRLLGPCLVWSPSFSSLMMARSFDVSARGPSPSHPFHDSRLTDFQPWSSTAVSLTL